MSIIIVTASKHRADTKLGFNFKTTDDATIITKIDEKSIFANTKLQVGQKILTINQMVVHQSMSAVLASLGSGEVTVVVENPPTDDNKAIFQFIQSNKEGPKVSSWSGGNKKPSKKADYYGMMLNNTCPSALKEAKLPLDKWLIIHALIVGKLMPISVQCVKSVHDIVPKICQPTTMRDESYYSNLTTDKMVNACILQSNANLVAISVKDQINSITTKFGVMAVLESECIPRAGIMNKDVNVPIGFSFHPISATSAVPIAVALPNAPPLGL